MQREGRGSRIYRLLNLNLLGCFAARLSYWYIYSDTDLPQLSACSAFLSIVIDCCFVTQQWGHFQGVKRFGRELNKAILAVAYESRGTR